MSVQTAIFVLRKPKLSAHTHHHRTGSLRHASLPIRLPSVEEERSDDAVSEESKHAILLVPRMAERAALKPPHPPEAENWDDDFEFHSPTEDHPKTGDAPVRTSFSAANRESIVWEDDDDEPLDQKLASTSRQAPQADSGDWGDSDDDGLRGVRRAGLAPKTLASPDPSPGKWTTDGEDNFGPDASPYDVDRTVTLNNRSNFPPPPDAYTGTRSAMSSSASLPSSSQHHVHIPNPADRYSPTPYSPTSPTLSSAFSMGASSTAHLRQTTSRHSSMVSPPIVYQPPPRPRRRLRKKSRPPQAEVGDIFEMEEQHHHHRGFQDELEESMDSSNHQSPKSTLHRRPGSSAGPSAHQIFSQPAAAPALRSRSKSQSSQPPSSHHHHPAPGPLPKLPPHPPSAMVQSHTTSDMRGDGTGTAEGTSQSFVPSSPSSKAPLLSRIGSMKNWSNKRKARHSSQSNIPSTLYMDAADTSSASESHWNDEDRPLTTPEPPRESTESPSSWAYRDSSPPVDSPSETSGVLSRKGSRRSYASSTRQPKPALSKVLGLMASSTAPPAGQERSLRRPMSLVQQAPSRPSSSTRPATYGRSTSNPFVQEYSSSSSSKSRPALSSSASFFGLISNHRRNKSIGADSLADESFGNLTSPPALPPLPSTPRTPRPKSPPAAESKIIISDKPPVLPALPPIDIELSPPSPPRLLASAPQPVQSTPTSFMVLSQHFPGIAANSSPSRNPGATSSLGRANGMALLAGNSPGSMRRNSLGDLKIPARISRNQVALKSNLTMVREFAAIVEQLKELQNNYGKTVTNIRQTLDAGDGTKSSVERLGNGHGVRPPGAGPPLLHDPTLRQTTEAMKRLDDEYALWWECAELLIELGGGAKDEREASVEPETIPESPTAAASKSSVALVEPSQSFGPASRERERAITLGGTEGSELAASAAAAAGAGKGSGPWGASTGRHGLSQRQLALLKEMLTTPDPSTLSLPLFSSPSADRAKPQNPLTFKDQSGPPPSFQSRQHQPYRSNFPAASAITLPESTTSSSAPSRSRSRLPPVSFGSKDQPASPTKGEGKARRGSRLGLTGIRDMLRSLKKASTSQPPVTLPSVQSRANESQSSFDSRQGHGAPPPSAPLPGQRQVSRSRKGKGSTDATTVTGAEANMSPEPNRSPLPEFPSRPFSSQANRKSPRRPSLASLFRIGNSNKGERKKSAKQPNPQDSGTGNASSAADTTTEDDSDWDRIDSASDLDISVRCVSRAETAEVEHDKTTNQATVRGRKTLPPPVSPEAPPPLPSAYPGIPSASQSSLSLRSSPHHRPTRLPMSIKEEPGYPVPPPTQRSTSHTHQRPPSRSRGRQTTNGSLPPMPFNSLLATIANDGPMPEETNSQVPTNPHPPLPPPPSTPEVRLAMTPENIKPLLECSREVSARLNDCLKELERLNLAVTST